MNNLCKRCHTALHDMGRDVELYSSKPLMPRPCVKCGESTTDYLVPWSDWTKALFYPVGLSE